MNMEVIMLSEISQREKDKYSMMSGKKKKKFIEPEREMVAARGTD